ncbi:MAG: CheR family methyltransferase [bacterium]
MKESTSVRSDDFQTFLRAILPAMGYRWRRFDRRNIRRRVHSRMESLRIYELGKYAQLVTRDTAEQATLDSLLRLTITRFFRNAWLWADLGSLIPETGGCLGGNETLKIWSAGCAGGEEPFSMAMLLDDLSRSGHVKHPWTILGTDTDAPSLKRAQEATYRWGSIREIPKHLQDRWFREDDGLWTLTEEIRSFVEVRQHDLLTTSPPGRFHMVLLRNSILTYNTDEIQRKVLGRIHECLSVPGYLIIGRTEELPEGVGFEEVSKCIYIKT